MIEAQIEKSELAPSDYLLGCLKFSAFSLLILFFILHHHLCKLLIRNEVKLLRYYLKSLRYTSSVGLWLLNIKATFIGKNEQSGPLLMVCNHLSYLDILILFSKYPALFITSQEMKEVFLLGHLTELAGCFHVERRRKLLSPALMAKELDDMKEKLSLGMNLFLFPEGTSSDGVTVGKFKAHFFQTAIDGAVPVQPLALIYELNDKNRDSICWYGDMTFADHLFRACCQKRINATVIELEKIPTFPGMDRLELASQCQQNIRNTYEGNYGSRMSLSFWTGS